MHSEGDIDKTRLMEAATKLDSILRSEDSEKNKFIKVAAFAFKSGYLKDNSSVYKFLAETNFVFKELQKFLNGQSEVQL